MIRTLFPLLALFSAMPAHANDLYQGGNWPALASDRKASRAGDLLTILILANNTASNTVTQGSHKSTSIGGDVSGGKGVGSGDFARSGGLGFGGDYNGQGTNTRADRMAAQLSATVSEVLPNGDLVVSGWQTLTISGDRTNIRVTGRVRPEDIGTDNAVSSARLAEARIEYDGKGYTSRSAKPGIVTRIFNLLGIL